MPKRPPTDAAEFIPDRPSLSSARAASKDCRACELWKRGTQTVFGEGGRKAELMFVGEQPGDAEDLAGRPFVGPAGKLLDRVLADDRGAFVTSSLAPLVLATVHPSSILRAPDADTRREETVRFADDLRLVVRALRKGVR